MICHSAPIARDLGPDVVPSMGPRSPFGTSYVDKRRQCGTEWPDGLKHMLIGIDGSTETPSVLPTAVDWARELDLDVQRAMAIHPLDTAPPRPCFGRHADQIEAEGLHVRPSVVRSSYPAGPLADLAESLDVGLVAMNSHSRRAGVAT